MISPYFLARLKGMHQSAYLPTCKAKANEGMFAAEEPSHTARIEAGSDPRGHLGVTWGVYLCAGKPPLADIILSHPPDLTRCDGVIGLVTAAMSGNIQYRGAAS